MSGKRRLGPVWITVALIGWASGLAVGGPWDALFSLKHVEADPDKSYALTEQNGPWMILACTFSGERAQQQAHELVHELRKRYKLEAYTFDKSFDHGEYVYGLGVNRYGGPKKMRYRRGSEFDEVAVMVGNYASVDDPEAQRTLQKLKYCQPESLMLDRDKPTSRTLAAWRLIQRQVLAADNPKKKKGPMGHAMITTNPVLPKDYFVPQGLDPLVLKANEGVKHCLLDCPGKYSVQVATFRGGLVTRQGEIAAVNSGRKDMKSQLVEAAEKAHRLTEALRIKGYEAYEFHDRYASIVTVGSFDWATRGPRNGQLNPAIQAVIDRFAGRQTGLGGPTGGLVQQTLIGIPFDLAPKAVHVPRRSISAQLNRSVTGVF